MWKLFPTFPRRCEKAADSEETVYLMVGKLRLIDPERLDLFSFVASPHPLSKVGPSLMWHQTRLLQCSGSSLLLRAFRAQTLQTLVPEVRPAAGVATLAG